MEIIDDDDSDYDTSFTGGMYKYLPIVLSNCQLVIFIHLKLELLTQVPVSVDRNYL